MAKGCLAMLASMTFLGVFICSIVMFVMFGPKNPFLGFAFGAGVVALAAAAGFRFPALLSFTSVRERTEERAFARFASTLTKVAIENSDDPRGNGLKLAQLMGWMWTIIVGGGALLMAVMIVGMLLEGNALAETTGASVFCGFLTATAAITWKFLARIYPV